MIKRVTGYIVSVVGIGVMAVGFNIIPLKWEILNIIPAQYVGGAGMGLVGIGVLMALMDGGRKGKKGESEVPIYEGVGRSRRVVGYRRD